MKHKTSELTGALLDAAVADALGIRREMTAGQCYVFAKQARNIVRGGVVIPAGYEEAARLFAPSSGGRDATEIIERERICISYSDQGGQVRGCWTAYVHDGDGDLFQHEDSPWVAAMRARVASKFGEEVDL